MPKMEVKITEMDTLVVPAIIAKTQTELDGVLGRVRGK